MFPILLLMLVLPFFSLIPILLLDEIHSHAVSLLFTLMVFLLAVASIYLASQNGLQALSLSYQYITQLGVTLDLQLTQLSLILVFTTIIVFFAASLAGRYFVSKDTRLYNAILMMAEGSAIGVFLSGNLFLFYVFWEISEVAMFFMIFVYGSYDRRYAAIKFMIYSMISGLLLLIGIMLLYSYTIPHTFDMLAIEQNAARLPLSVQQITMVLLLVAFMIKIPIFPFHSWMPDAHTEAPTTGSMILAGVSLNFGGYGLLLIFLLVPIAINYTVYLAIIFGFSAIYGSLVALKQVHLKRMIAYTSMVSMGMVALGASSLNSFGTSGALYGMLSHGIAISMLFLIAGTVERMFGTLIISKVKGIIDTAPRIAYMFLFGSFAIIGLPFTAGFIADLLIFIGSFARFGIASLIPIAAVPIVGAYLFWVIEKSFFAVKSVSKPYEIMGKEIVYSGSFLIALTIILGVLPAVLLWVSGL